MQVWDVPVRYFAREKTPGDHHPTIPQATPEGAAGIDHAPWDGNCRSSVTRSIFLNENPTSLILDNIAYFWMTFPKVEMGKGIKMD